MTKTAGGPPAMLVVTGLSGAGKSTVLAALGDAGYYCVDNLPPSLAASVPEVCNKAGIDRVALGMDVRVGAFVDGAERAIKNMKDASAALQVWFLDATDDILVRRFSETRRPHSLLIGQKNPASTSGVLGGVRMERQRLVKIRALATRIVDTSLLTVHDLRRHVLELSKDATSKAAPLLVRMASFGFKYGAPLDADVMFDVRFLENPYFDPTLRDLSGLDTSVRDFVLSSSHCQELLDHLTNLLVFSVPRFQAEGKSYLTLAIGCTGGRHRSVAIAEELSKRIESKTNQAIIIVHRDVDKNAMLTTEPKQITL